MSNIENLIKEAEATPIDEELKELAMLKKHEYQTIREKAAKRLGFIGVTALDESVKEMRTELKNDNIVDTDSFFEEIQPYDGVVDTSSLLGEIRDVINDYLFLPPFADVVLTFWIAHAHVYQCFKISPRLVITSTDPESGKSMVLDVLEQLLPKPLLIHNVTASAFCRSVKEYRPTLLLDEYDTYMKNNEDIRGVINAGQKFNGKHLKCEGDDHKPTFFPCYCPVALAGIGKLHATVMSRSHIIKMKPAKPFELKKDFDYDDLDREKLLRSKLVRWALDNQDALKKSKPKLHESLKNRKKDSWKPFYAIAKLAGDKWVDLANYTVEATHKGRSLSFKEKLLADIRYIFELSNLEEISSEDLAKKLNNLEFRRYDELNDGNGATQNWIGSMLSGYEIKTTRLNVYVDGERIQKRGYKREMFEDTWDRHLGCDVEYENQIDSPNTSEVIPFPSESPDQAVTPSHVNAGAGFKPNQSVTSEIAVTPENPRKVNGSNGCDVVTDENLDLGAAENVLNSPIKRVENILTYARQHHIHLEGNGGTLVMEAPSNLLTEQFLSEVKKHKTELIQALFIKVLQISRRAMPFLIPEYSLFLSTYLSASLHSR